MSCSSDLSSVEDCDVLGLDAAEDNLDEVVFEENMSEKIMEAIVSSFPFLSISFLNLGHFIGNGLNSTKKFMLPWIHATSESQSNLMQNLLNIFDKDLDGNISMAELMNHADDWSEVASNTDEKVSLMQSSVAFFDWRFIYLLWKTFGGLLLVSALATVIPGRIHSLSGQILRWPILAVTYTMIMSELTMYVIVRLVIGMAEATFINTEHGKLRKKLENASSYGEWYGIAKELDKSQGRVKWQDTVDDNTAALYDWGFIRELIFDMKAAREEENLERAMAVLQQCTKRNIGGVMNEDLFSCTNTGEPKEIVTDFFKEIETTLLWLTSKVMMNKSTSESSNNVHESQTRQIIEKKNETTDKNEVVDHLVGLGSAVAGWAIQSINKGNKNNTLVTERTLGEATPKNLEGPEQKKQRKQKERVKLFLQRVKATYGRTALCLSGGAMMGCYHFGHVKALLEEGVLPHIMSGTSAGSIIAALICTRTDKEIERDLRPEILEQKTKCFSRSWLEMVKSIYQNGCAFDRDEWIDLIKWFCCGDMTFEEAYKKTGRVLCITLSTTTKKAPPVLVNYVTAPNVTIASAVVASAAVPGLIKPVLLHIKEDGIVRNQEENKDQAYWDGSLEQDIPMSGLAEMFNCQFFLAAQCNPHIVPFFHNSKGDVGRPSRWSRNIQQNSWRGGFILAALEMYLKIGMRAKFHFLNDLEAAVGFTSTLMTQVYGGTTTIYPQVSIFDYNKLITNPTVPFLEQCFQRGSVAAYKHCAMMKLHYSAVRAVDKSLDMLEGRRSSAILMKTPSGRFIKPGRGYSVNKSVLTSINEALIDLEASGDLNEEE